MRKLLPAAGLATALACSSPHAPVSPEPAVVPRVALLPCAVRGVGRAAFCGVVPVPEDRSTRAGRVVELEVVVVPASDHDHAAPDPVFVLAGGPGQAATDAAADYAQTFTAALTTRDFVFLDQRGTGRHSPLRCEMLGVDGDLGTLAGGALPEDRLRQCLAHMDARPDLYTTAIAVEDLDEAAVRLGYERVNLLAGSYGTQVAQEMVRRHRSRVRAAVLDGVAPVDTPFVLAFASNAQHALDALMDECLRDAVCSATFPDLPADLGRALARLRAEPVRVTAPLEGSARVTATLDADALAMAVRGLLYSVDSRALIPAVLHAAATGDDAAIAPLIVRGAGMTARGLSVGMFLSVTCSEQVADVTRREAAGAADRTFLGMARAGPILQACTFWPRGAVPGDFHTPVESDAPLLLLSGTMDPATPMQWAEHARATLPNAQQVLVPGGAHDVADVGCVPALVARFLDAPGAPVDASCVVPVRTKFVTRLGR
jgi:pimeloyl-ACP methyl ester carboxylesterase